MNFTNFAAILGWPFAMALAWLAGEYGHRWLGLPRISLYGIVGFALANLQAGMLQGPAPDITTPMLVANVAFGLILFEFGYRINLRWIRSNPWIGATVLLESAATFGVVYAVGAWHGMPVVIALLLAALSVAASPAAVLRVVNEERSAGQVTERVLHLTAFNSVLGVLAFKVIVGLWIFQTSGNLWQAVSRSLLLLIVSAGLGAVFGVAVPAILRRLGKMNQDATVAFAIAVILLVAVAHTVGCSPVLAALTFGLVARHRRVALSQAQRNFGALGDLLTVLLFAFVASTIEWQRVVEGLEVGIAVVVVRLAAKTLSVVALAHQSGTSWRKGALTGLALAPVSVFAMLLLDQERSLGVDLIDQLAPLAAATLLLEIAGPILTQRALKWAHETPDRHEH